MIWAHLRLSTWHLFEACYFRRQHLACLFHSLVLVHTAETSVKNKAPSIGEFSFSFCSCSSRHPIWLTLLPSSCLTLYLFPPPAIYLCKRTMQNKARLELADYEAVSTLSFKFSDCQEALSSLLSLCPDHNMMTVWISCFPAETVPSGALKCQYPFFPAISHYQIADFCSNLSMVIFLYREHHLAEIMAVIYWPQNIYKSIYRLTWHQQINIVSRGALLQCWSLAVVQY